jgi:hypothetical protein
MTSRDAVVQLHFSHAADKPSLGDPAVVDRLVSEFVQAVIGVRNDFLAGKPGADNPIQRIEQLASNAGDVIMGRHADYQAMAWQNPIRLGSTIRYLCQEIRDYPDPGQALFMFLSTQVVTSMIAVEEKRMHPEQSAQKLRVVINDVVDRILGVQ